jgi:hypothetical protein
LFARLVLKPVPTVVETGVETGVDGLAGTRAADRADGVILSSHTELSGRATRGCLGVLGRWGNLHGLLSAWGVIAAQLRSL